MSKLIRLPTKQEELSTRIPTNKKISSRKPALHLSPYHKFTNDSSLRNLNHIGTYSLHNTKKVWNFEKNKSNNNQDMRILLLSSEQAQRDKDNKKMIVFLRELRFYNSLSSFSLEISHLLNDIVKRNITKPITIAFKYLKTLEYFKLALVKVKQSNIELIARVLASCKNFKTLKELEINFVEIDTSMDYDPHPHLIKAVKELKYLKKFSFEMLFFRKLFFEGYNQLLKALAIKNLQQIKVSYSKYLHDYGKNITYNDVFKNFVKFKHLRELNVVLDSKIQMAEVGKYFEKLKELRVLKIEFNFGNLFGVYIMNVLAQQLSKLKFLSNLEIMIPLKSEAWWNSNESFDCFINFKTLKRLGLKFEGIYRQELDKKLKELKFKLKLDALFIKFDNYDFYFNGFE